MRRIPIAEVQPGMVLATPINTPDGMMILNSDVTLTEKHIKRIKDVSTNFIYIKDDEIEAEAPQVKTIRLAKTAEISKLAQKVPVGKGVENEEKAKDMVLSIIDKWLKNPLVIKNICDISLCSDYLLSHSVNVMVYSLLIGMQLEYDDMRLRDLGIGALLHDVGIASVSSEIVNKEGALTPKELEEMKKHPELGYETLQKNSYLNLTSAHCAYQHHERFDGSGYPRKLAGDKIHQFAQIVGVADVFAALTSSNSFRRAVPLYTAVVLLLKSRNTYFNPEIVKAFVEGVMPYKIRSLVKMSNGCVAEIIDYRNNDVTHPVLRLMYDQEQNRISQLTEMDLAKEPGFYIADTWDHKELKK